MRVASALLVVGACAPRATEIRSAEAPRASAPEQATAGTAPAPSAWFAGLLVSQISLSQPKGAEPRVTGEQYFFVSGRNLLVRETSVDGAVVYELTYDPERNVVYQLAPEFKIVEASEKPDVELAYTGNFRTILGYTCHELVRHSPGETTHAWVAPRIRVEPQAFAALSYLGFAKQLAFTGGALELYGEVELEDRVIYVQAMRIEERPLGEDTWKLDAARSRATR